MSAPRRTMPPCSPCPCSPTPQCGPPTRCRTCCVRRMRTAMAMRSLCRPPPSHVNSQWSQVYPQSLPLALPLALPPALTLAPNCVIFQNPGSVMTCCPRRFILCAPPQRRPRQPSPMLSSLQQRTLSQLLPMHSAYCYNRHLQTRR